jgi:NitT/TauT family transport system substrate-binding protein
MRKVTKRLAFSLLAASLVVSSGAALADKKTDVKFLITTTKIEPGHSTISSLQQDPGFWKQEGLNVQIIGVEGSSLAVQQVGSGNADFASVGPDVLLAARQHGVPIKAFYAIVPHTIFRLMVPAESAIQSASDLKGKTIGIPSTASASYPFSKAILSASGLNPETDVHWLTVGAGAQAALALQRDQIQAMAGWDTMQAAFENRGMKFRDIKAPFVDQLLGQVLIAREDFLAQHPETAVAIARGIAEATLYALTYPEKTLTNHWKLYPQSRPREGTDAEKMKAGIADLESRLVAMKVPDWPKTPYGYIAPASFDKTAELAVKEGQVSDRSAIEGAYTNQWITQINQFDKAHVLAEKTSAK